MPIDNKQEAQGDQQMVCKDCKVELVPHEDDEMQCCCHCGNPPCSKCCDSRMECPECGEVYEEEE